MKSVTVMTWFFYLWLGLGIAGLGWIWFGGGLQFFLRHPAITNLPSSEPGLRLFFGAMTILFLVVAVAGFATGPWHAAE